MIKLSDVQIDAIKDTCRRNYPNETVFGVTEDNIVIEFDNIHEDPINMFKIDAEVFYNNNCIALIHSHTIQIGDEGHSECYIDPRSPSEADMILQKQMDIPFGILALDEETILDIVWFPDLDANILGQEYISGINDCYTLIQRYYHQHLGIELASVPHSATWFENNPNMYEENYEAHGFYEVNISDIKNGDMILIRIHHDTPTHAGVYVSGDTFYHHLINKLSHEDSLIRWMKRITKVLRLKND